MKTKNIFYALLTTGLFVITGTTLTPSTVTALSGSEFKAGNIISDGVFFNRNTMSAADIQNWLNSKVPSCDTNGSKMYNSTQTRAQYGESRGYPAPYTCLKDYSQDTASRVAETGLCNAYTGGVKSSAQILYDVAQACDINPHVLLVLLQKEQTLITDEWPWPIQYRSATGYGCPDTAPCDAEYYGFFNQVYNAARGFKKYARDAAQYSYLPNRNNTILFNPNSACGSSTVFIENQATANLYIYTPYQPNQAALNNLYGTGDGCSAYGNRNFWRMFNDWFGSTQTSIPYAWSITQQGMYADSARTKPFTSPSVNVAPGQKAYLRVTARNLGYQTWTQSIVNLGTTNARDRSSIFADVSWTSPARVKLLESSVLPGQLGTFEFSLTAPMQTGLYQEYYSLVADGQTWMNDPGLYYSINVLDRQDPSNSLRTGLSSGQMLGVGDYLLSPDSQNVLRLQEGGELSLLANFRSVWTNGVKSSSIKGLYMQSDGNLVAYNNAGTALWNTGTGGNSGAYLSMQTDGNLVIYSTSGVPLWASGSVGTPDYLSQVNVTLGNATLYPGQFLKTPDGKYRMVLQWDGNLVIYAGTKAIWASATTGRSTSHMSMQSDGNLVLYAAGNYPVWISNTSSRGPSTLAMQPDGNLVIYGSAGPTWASNTAGRQ